MNKKRIIKFATAFLLVLALINTTAVYAASFSVGASKSSVAPGGTFSVNISVGGAGQFSVSASNGSVSSSSLWVDGSASVTVTAGQSGQTTVTVSASDVTASDESPITGSKSVTVSIKTPSSGGSSGGSSSGSGTTEKPKEEEDTRSKENNLESLSVSAGTLSPEFAAGTTTYKVELTSDVENITVDAKAKDSKATVSGTGEHELKIGENNISVTVKAENGSKKTYTVSVYVTEKPQQFVNVNDQEYGILNDLSKTDLPKGFEKATITIDEKEVTALKNEKLGITLLYLQSSADQKTGFYIYENDTVIGEYKTITVNDKIYVLLQAPKDLAGVENLKTGTVTIGDVEVNCWNFDEKEKENYAIVYLLNEEGEKSLYTYENTEGTLQKYIPVQQKSGMDTLTYVFIGTTVVFVVSTAALAYLYINFKKKSISAIKDYYNLKSQDD